MYRSIHMFITTPEDIYCVFIVYLLWAEVIKYLRCVSLSCS